MTAKDREIVLSKLEIIKSFIGDYIEQGLPIAQVSYLEWIDDIARLVKSLDNKNNLVNITINGRKPRSTNSHR